MLYLKRPGEDSFDSVTSGCTLPGDMSSDKGKSGTSFFSLVVGAGIGAVFGAAIGVAWVLGHKIPIDEERQKRVRPGSSAPRHTLTRAQLPKRHLKYLFTSDHRMSNEFKEYLTEVFQLADSNQDGGLSQEDLQNFVLVIRNEPIEPQQLTWYFQTFETNADEHLTLNGFLKSYEWPLLLYSSGKLSLEQVLQSYHEELKSFGCVVDEIIENE